jgi:hypothetical protein
MAKKRRRAKKASFTDSDRLAIVLFCVAGIMAFLLAWLIKTPAWVFASLIAMAAFVVYPVGHIFRSWSTRIITLIALWIMVGLFGTHIWKQINSPEGRLARIATEIASCPSNSLRYIIGDGNVFSGGICGIEITSPICFVMGDKNYVYARNDGGKAFCSAFGPSGIGR